MVLLIHFVTNSIFDNRAVNAMHTVTTPFRLQCRPPALPPSSRRCGPSRWRWGAPSATRSPCGAAAFPGASLQIPFPVGRALRIWFNYVHPHALRKNLIPSHPGFFSNRASLSQYFLQPKPDPMLHITKCQNQKLNFTLNNVQFLFSF